MVINIFLTEKVSSVLCVNPEYQLEFPHSLNNYFPSKKRTFRFLFQINNLYRHNRQFVSVFQIQRWLNS